MIHNSKGLFIYANSDTSPLPRCPDTYLYTLSEIDARIRGTNEKKATDRFPLRVAWSRRERKTESPSGKTGRDKAPRSFDRVNEINGSPEFIPKIAYITHTPWVMKLIVLILLSWIISYLLIVWLFIELASLFIQLIQLTFLWRFHFMGIRFVLDSIFLLIANRIRSDEMWYKAGETKLEEIL